MKKSLLTAAAATAFFSTAAIAAVTFDSNTGTGFVGKGDVQLAFGWNNAQLQANSTGVSFSYNSTTENSWTCTKLQELGNGGINEIVQVRNNESSTQGLISHIERVRNQITGYQIIGYNGGVTTTTDGPATGSCPSNPSGFVYDEGSLQTDSTGGGLTAHYGGNSVPLQ